MASQSLNCSWTHNSWNKSFHHDASPTAPSQPQVTANPDVAGTGVLIGFMGSGYVCWVILFVYYLVAYDPHQGTLSQHVNPIDERILTWFRERTGEFSCKWEAGLEKCMILLGDQQIVTGIAILGSAYLQLDNGFSVYHWQMTIWLAWFSSVTHLGALSVLRNYLREYPALRTQRLLLMLMIAVMLVVAILPTGSSVWLLSPGEQAGCYFQSLAESWRVPGPSWKFRGPNVPWNEASLALTTITILTTSYITRFVKLFHQSSKYARVHLRVKPGRHIKRGLDALLRMAKSVGPKWSGWTIAIFYKPFLVVFLIAMVICDLVESMLWEILWLMYAVLWASIRLFALKADVSSLDSQENTWNFSQWLPTLLLAVPVLSMAEVCYEAWKTPGKMLAEIQHASVATESLHIFRAGSEAESGGIPPITEAESSIERSTVIIPPYDDNFYQYSWFCGLVFLLLASTVAAAILVLSWAYSSAEMRYFMKGGLLTLTFNLSMFHVPTIFAYTFLLVRTGNSISTAEWLVQRVCMGKRKKAQKTALIVVQCVLLLLSLFIMFILFYYFG